MYDNETKELAISFRVKEKMSLSQISKKLNISKSTASLWLKSFPLDNVELLREENRKKGVESHVKICRAKRRSYQDFGASLVKNETDFTACCALYWGEGAKNPNVASLTNVDGNMLVFFKNCLMKYFDVDVDEFKIYINCYVNTKTDIDIAENYWLDKLSLTRQSLGKGTYKFNKKAQPYQYGVCMLSLCRTDVVQAIYGGIQCYFGFQNKKWLN